MATEATPLLNSILEIHDLSSGAFRALLALLSFRNKSSGLCCPKIATLGERLGVPRRTLCRWLAELRLAGVVGVTHRRGSNSYQINLSKNGGKSCGCEEPAMPEMAHLAMPKVAHVRVPKVAHLEASILNEQTVLLTDREEPPPPLSSEAGKTPVKKAAAAAVLPLFDNQENPTLKTEAARLVAELMPQHPEPGNQPKAVAEVQKVLAAGTATVETIRSSHAAWRVRWATYAAGRFVPQLWRWLHDGDWEHAPVERKPVRSETWVERRERERREYDERTYRTYAENEMWDVLREYGGDELVEEWREKVKIAS